MRRYPYKLEMWHEDDATQNEDGSWTEGKGCWRYVCDCNLRQNGRSAQVKLSDGTLFTYSYKAVIPSRVKPIPIGSRVRVVSDGLNMFDMRPVKESSKVYSVVGFDPFKQRFQDKELWL